MLTLQQIKASAPRLTKVPCPEWATDGQPEGEAFVYVRGMTGAEREEWEDLCTSRRGSNGKLSTSRGMRVQVVAQLTCDEAGEPLFSSDDEAWLNEKSGAVLDRIFDACMDASGLSEAMQKAAAKNSPTPSSVSGST